MFHNYIFDLYGTLVDIHTNEGKPSLWNKVAMAYSLQGAVYTSKEIKKRYQELIDRQEKEQAVGGRDTEIQLKEVFLQLYLDKGKEPSEGQVADMGIFFRTLSIEKLRLFDGADRLLERLREAGKGIYLLSNAQRMFTEPEMRMLGIYDKFDGILYSSDVGYKKPSPYFYRSLFEKYALEKETSVMVGNDREADIGGACRFGIRSMYLHTEQSPEYTGALPDTCRELKEIGEVY